MIAGLADEDYLSLTMATHNYGWYLNPELKNYENTESHVLLLKIMNDVYPITVGVVYQITEAYGNILRIVTYQKNGTQQAMVEFENKDMARSAKEALNGANIYSGCCTLDIEYAEVPRLSVDENAESRSWDFTTAAWLVPSIQPEKTVSLVVCGLDRTTLSCDNLFNLFCLYGNVMEVKYLNCDGRPAIVQMGDAASADRAIYNLDGLVLFNTKITISYCRHDCATGDSPIYTLIDGSPSFKSYVESKNNRFSNVDSMTKKNHEPQPPSKVLHFYNTPTDLSVEQLQQLFYSCVQVRVVQGKSKKSSSGHLQFRTTQDAVESLVKLNHFPLWSKLTSKRPYITKLCFSTAPSLYQTHST